MKNEEFEKKIKTSFPFLWGPEGYWMYNYYKDKMYEMSNMDNEYLKGCIGTLEKFKIQIEKASSKYHKEDLKQMRDNKLDELNYELKSRSSK